MSAPEEKQVSERPWTKGLTRRSFLVGLVAAPAVIRLAQLMPVKALEMPSPIVWQSWPWAQTHPTIDYASGTISGSMRWQMSRIAAHREIWPGFVWRPAALSRALNDKE